MLALEAEHGPELVFMAALLHNFDTAIESAKKTGFPHFYAIAIESFARALSMATDAKGLDFNKIIELSKQINGYASTIAKELNLSQSNTGDTNSVTKPEPNPPA